MNKTLKAAGFALVLTMMMGAECDASNDYECESLELENDSSSVEILTLHCVEVPEVVTQPDGTVTVKMTEKCWPVKKTFKGKVKYSRYGGHTGLKVSASVEDFFVAKK